ncbi:UNVERIFIED_CONTAM: hypothetical protein GTU68_044535 [Idotea baltica]|nr:hypothetical protein [Idotea baltica]
MLEMRIGGRCISSKSLSSTLKDSF